MHCLTQGAMFTTIYLYYILHLLYIVCTYAEVDVNAFGWIYWCLSVYHKLLFMMRLCFLNFLLMEFMVTNAMGIDNLYIYSLFKRQRPITE